MQAFLYVALVAILFLRPGTPAYSKSGARPQDPWWKHAVIYEIYPRSFADGKDCGTGNLKGIIEKLDYLADLGIDAIWLTPCFPSPQVDFGYDVSDYCDIAPEYGSMEDFDRLVEEAGKRNIRVIMDLVLNHSSDQHDWFKQSRSSRSNPKRDWYVWRDGKGKGKPPNNWLSLFGGSAWQWDDRTKQYYYHFFYREQPDLNWRNPQVRKAMYDVARFWLDRGVAGFRLDAITTTFEDPELKDNPLKPGKNSYGDPNMEYKYNYRLPQVHEIMRELRQVLDSYQDHRVLIGETSVDSIEELARMYGKNNDEIQLPMNFFFAYINKLSAAAFREQIEAAENNPAGGWPVYLFSNHDSVRHYDRYGDGKNNDRIARLMAALLLTLRGTPILYYGEEIGMQNNDPKRKEDVKDPIGIVGWPEQKGRDGERTPMQWTDGKNAGFCTVKPWLPVAGNYKTHNVKLESKDPGSVLNCYKKLIKLRRNNHAIKYGDYKALDVSNKSVLSYLRKTENKAAVIVLNMSNKKQLVNLNLKPAGINTTTATTLLSSESQQPDKVNTRKLSLNPFGFMVIDIN